MKVYIHNLILNSLIMLNFISDNIFYFSHRFDCINKNAGPGHCHRKSRTIDKCFRWFILPGVLAVWMELNALFPYVTPGSIDLILASDGGCSRFGDGDLIALRLL